MSLQTACPICHTIFKVDEHQLASAQGMVQCGVCGMVFNAREHLKVEPAQPDATFTEAPAVVGDISTDTPEIATTAALCAPEPMVVEQPAQDEDAIITATMSTPPAIGTASTDEPPNIDKASHDLPIIQFKKHTSTQRRVIYILLATALSGGLVLQLGLQYKDQLSARFPALLPIYGSICDGALCSMTIPYDVSQITLTNSSFEIDPKHKDHIIVSLDMTNNAEMVLQYPRIALTLLDNDERVISVRNLSAHDYLPTDGQSNALMPHDDVNIKLLIMVDAEAVSGYKIKLF